MLKKTIALVNKNIQAGGNPQIHGHKNPLPNLSDLFYVRPNLLKSLPEAQRIQYAKEVCSYFADMVKQNSDYIGTNRSTQISLYKQVLDNGNYRILERDGKIVGIIMFKTYKRGKEAEGGVVRLEKAVVDKSVVELEGFMEFIDEFCKECKDDLGARIVISQEKRGETLLSRALLGVGFNEVDVEQEEVQYRIYKTADTYAIYKRELR